MAVLDAEKRQLFAREFIACGNATEAARRAGVPEASAATVGNRWKRDQRVIALIQEELGAALKELAPSALAALRQLVASDKTPASVRLAAARDILDRVGFVPPKRAEVTVTNVETDIAHLTRAQLEAMAAAACAELADSG